MGNMHVSVIQTHDHHAFDSREGIAVEGPQRAASFLGCFVGGGGGKVGKGVDIKRDCNH